MSYFLTKEPFATACVSISSDKECYLGLDDVKSIIDDVKKNCYIDKLLSIEPKLNTVKKQFKLPSEKRIHLEEKLKAKIQEKKKKRT
jgi:hypothetical protein